MELVFKIPTFYKNRFGDEPEINEFCEAICEIAKNNEYSTKVNRIDVIPCILPNNLILDGYGKEFTKIEIKYKLAAIARQINFDAYQNATIDEKKDILLEFLITTLEEVKNKIGFDLGTFKKDLLL